MNGRGVTSHSIRTSRGRPGAGRIRPIRPPASVSCTSRRLPSPVRRSSRLDSTERGPGDLEQLLPPG